MRADTKYNTMLIMSSICEWHLESKLVREYVPEIVKILIQGID